MHNQLGEMTSNTPVVRESISRRFGMQKFREMQRNTLKQLCFTGEYQQDLNNTQYLQQSANLNNKALNDNSSLMIKEDISNNNKLQKKIDTLCKNETVEDFDKKSEFETKPSPFQKQNDSSKGEKQLSQANYCDSLSEGSYNQSEDEFDELNLDKEREELLFVQLPQANNLEENKASSLGQYLKYSDIKGGIEGENENLSADELNENVNFSIHKSSKALAHKKPENNEAIEDRRCPDKGVEQRLSTNLFSDTKKSYSIEKEKSKLNNSFNAIRSGDFGTKITAEEFQPEKDSELPEDNANLKVRSEMKPDYKNKSENKTNGLFMPLLHSNASLGKLMSPQIERKKSPLKLRNDNKDKDLTIHAKFLILFATLLLKSKRYNDCYDVCNIYGLK